MLASINALKGTMSLDPKKVFTGLMDFFSILLLGALPIYWEC